MLDKVPKTEALSKKAVEWRDKVTESEICSTAAPYTHEQLTALIALAVSKEPPPIRAAETSAAFDFARDCVVCGKPGHDHRSCKATCNTCNLNYCPGAPCAVAAKEVPKDIKNDNKRSLYGPLHDKLVAAHAKWHADGKPTTSSAEAPPPSEVPLGADSMGDEFFTLYCGSIEMCMPCSSDDSPDGM